jgi:hypothetical protein
MNPKAKLVGFLARFTRSRAVTDRHCLRVDRKTTHPEF